MQDFLEELRKLKKDFDRQLDQPAYLDCEHFDVMSQK